MVQQVIPLCAIADRDMAAELGEDHLKLYDYWAGLAAPGQLPFWRDFDPLGVPPALLSRLWVTEVRIDPPRLRYRLVGTQIVASYGIDTTGRDFAEVWPHIAVRPSYADRYIDAVRTGIPNFRRGKPILVTQHNWGLIENLMLPFQHPGLFGIVLGHSRLFSAQGKVIF